tara:strand:- start:2072 stop:2287 length:216 start_codon:yes stop_codon:yes gene_type:complete
MRRLLNQTQMLDAISVSKTRFNQMKNRDSQWYDPNLPKPINVYGDTKLRYYSEDVEAYIINRIEKAKSKAA